MARIALQHLSQHLTNPAAAPPARLLAATSLISSSHPRIRPLHRIAAQLRCWATRPLRRCTRPQRVECASRRASGGGRAGRRAARWRLISGERGCEGNSEGAGAPEDKLTYSSCSSLHAKTVPATAAAPVTCSRPPRGRLALRRERRRTLPCSPQSALSSRTRSSVLPAVPRDAHAPSYTRSCSLRRFESRSRSSLSRQSAELVSSLEGPPRPRSVRLEALLATAGSTSAQSCRSSPSRAAALRRAAVLGAHAPRSPCTCSSFASARAAS